ncbi:MAG TPA: hypothetical protein VK789_32105 [Bryobacteraceae bacterium]|nr:hypothetical protein [Bryobacteraceae bacterium]
MYARKRHLICTRGASRVSGIFGSSLLACVSLLLASCNGLPPSIKRDIAAEKDRLQQAEHELQHSRETVRDDLAHTPDLFNGTAVATEWPAKLQADQTTLDRAKDDLRQLDKLTRVSDRSRAEQLLREERSLRESVLHDSEAVEEQATKWLDFQRNTPHYLALMQSEYDRIQNADLGPVKQTVEKAERDWPAKKDALDSRLAALQDREKSGESQWKATESARQDAAAGKATGAEVATLIQANEALAADDVTKGADELQAQCGQLYNAWDKVLVDLDVSHRGLDTVYTEKIKTVKTHFVDVADKKTEVSSDDRWVDVSPSSYHAVENDLGMTIAHKDAGQFDSDATNTPQPPGFAYIATPEQGSNQYGYWSHGPDGHSFWTFLPEYLIMRELLWGHSYRPIIINEYNGYHEAQRMGRTYYGQETPAAPPKYGSHGTFTQERYAGSRYVQSGGFKGSAYSSSRSSAPPPSASKSFGFEPRDRGESPSVGKRFGSNNGGQRFGSGSRSLPRMPGKSFGRRR